MYVKIIVFYLVGLWVDVRGGPLPLRLTIDCGVYDEDYSLEVGISRIHKKEVQEADKFCKQIINLIPKALENGKFVIIKHENDQNPEGDTIVPTILAAPNFVERTPNLRSRSPKLKISRIKIPKLSVPKLESKNGVIAPKIGISKIPEQTTVISIPVLRQSSYAEELTSAEKVERFKKGVRKMLRVVKVMSQVDQYLTERMRLFVDRLAKTFDV